jgi:hypothetical protein
MRAGPRGVALLSIVAALAACGDGGPGPVLWPRPEVAPPAAAFLGARPWLLDLSTWAGVGCGAGEPDDARHLGDFGVGNGRVFALAGYACPINTLHTMAGPDYQQEGDFYPDTATQVFVGGAAPATLHGRMFRVRHAAILVSAERLVDLEVVTVTFAPTGDGVAPAVERAVVRVVIVRNASTDTVRDVEVRTDDATSAREGRARSLVLLDPAPPDPVPPDPARVPLGELAPGDERVLTLAWVTALDAAQEEETVTALRATTVDALLEATRDAWGAFLGRAARLESPDPRVDDLLEGMVVTVRTQQTCLGGVSPMSRYSLMWLRDTAGAVRFFLRVGLHEEARAMLEYLHLAAVVRGDYANALRLDYAPDPPPPEPDWAALPPMEGRTAAEGPSHLPLMSFWYHQATGDASLTAAQYEFLKRGVLAQGVDRGGLLGFSGDETYRAAMAASLGLDLEHDFVGCCTSANSSFLFVAAAESLALQASVLDRPDDAAALREQAALVRAAAEEVYWSPGAADATTGGGAYAPFRDRGAPAPLPPPFEDVTLAPLWVGYGSADDPRQRENVATVVTRLGRDDGSIQSPLDPGYHNVLGLAVTDGIYTGMVPGFALYNLALVDHPRAEAAFNLLGVAASPSGNFAEYQIHDDHSALQVLYNPAGGMGDMTARYRPWEGGINLDALVVYLTGFEPELIAGHVHLAPRLPNGWPRMRWTGLRVGVDRLDLLVEQQGKVRRVTVSTTADAPLTLYVHVPLPAATVRGVTVNGEPWPEGSSWIWSPFGETRVKLGARNVSAASPLVIEVEHEPTKP